jgi:hypothetical protein
MTRMVLDRSSESDSRTSSASSGSRQQSMAKEQSPLVKAASVVSVFQKRSPHAVQRSRSSSEKPTPAGVDRRFSMRISSGRRRPF